MNECEAQRCSQECANIYGSYQCYCRQGYQLAEDGHTCTGTSPLPRAPFLRDTTSRVPGSSSPHQAGDTGHTEALASYQSLSPSRAFPGCATLDKCFPHLTSVGRRIKLITVDA